MDSNTWEQAVSGVLANLRQSNQYREHRVLAPVDSTHVEWNGRQLVNFASNDYLGLSHHPLVVGAMAEAALAQGAGSGAAPLITGYSALHQDAEGRIARWKGAESALLLPSGYQANHAAVQTLAAGAERAGRGIRFLLDKLCHASLIDAVRGTGAPFRIFPHNHLQKLRRLLADAEPGQVQAVLTESIFSMDGDAADLAGLASLKAEYPFVLVLDEAHSSGVYGVGGAGLAVEMGLNSVADVTIVTLSKAAGCAGGAVCGSAVFRDAVVNLGRAYIFSTSVAPALAAAAIAAIGVMAADPGRQARVRGLAHRVRAELAGQGFTISPGDSPIIPIRLGSEVAALGAAIELLEQGMLVLAIRPPTVPRGQSRLRLTLSSEHTDEEIAGMLLAMKRLASGRCAV